MNEYGNGGSALNSTGIFEMGTTAKNHYGGISVSERVNGKLFTSLDDWLDEKRKKDGAEGLWRIHDKLYDMTSWMGKHPGGRFWLEVTKGTDITEAFECSHVSERAAGMLPNFYAREAKTPRHCLITFHENGFFRTLKRKIQERKLHVKTTKPALKTTLLADFLALLVFGCGFLGTIYSLWWAILSGGLLATLAVCAHNFFHMRNNWRMYYFNILLLSVREWRVSHALSHHLYPNTNLDLEITMMEPVLRFLPEEDKKFRYLSWFLFPFFALFFVYFQFTRRMLNVFTSWQFHSDELWGFLLPIALSIFSGKGLWVSFVTWNTIIMSGSFVFALIGLTAAHHHPDIYHDGDFLGDDKDFGLLQLAAVRNRYSVDGNFVLTMILFGEHALHHLFPTIDHSRLPSLNPVFYETCKEFNINFRPVTIKTLFIGMFQQLIRNYKNSKLNILENL